MKSINATHYELIPAYPSKDDRKANVVHAIVETPKGSPYKFALEASLGIIAYSEAMPHGYVWPYDYGFIPQTLGGDGDPLDIVVLLEQPTFSGCLHKVRILGAIRLVKNGDENDRFVAAPLRAHGVTAWTDGFDTLADVPSDAREHLEQFLHGYSATQGNAVEITGSVEASDAMKLIQRGHKAFSR
jgi:inorganic pyrophosphatase